MIEFNGATYDLGTLFWIGVGLLIVIIVLRLAFSLLLPIVIVAGLIFAGLFILFFADALQGGTALQQLIDLYLPQVIVAAGTALAAAGRIIRGDR